MAISLCPCGRGRPYDECCGPVHADGAGLGATAEQLMRARYSAYVRHDEGFLLRSWHPDTRPGVVAFDSDLTWTGLTVLDTARGAGLDNEGEVEFTARFTRRGEHLELRERSTFTRIGGRWVYVDGR